MKTYTACVYPCPGAVQKVISIIINEETDNKLTANVTVLKDGYYLFDKQYTRTYYPPEINKYQLKSIINDIRYGEGLENLNSTIIYNF